MNKGARNLLLEKFNIAGLCCYPLSGNNKPNSSEYFNEDDFLNYYGLEKLISLLLKLGYKNVNEILESENDQYIKVEDIDCYCGLEVIYCNESVDWAIYFSHENTVTFIGEGLLTGLKKDWLDWGKYKSPWEQNVI
jgi:hypothetical protein